MRSHSRLPVVALVVGFLFLPLGAAPGVAQQGWSAPGAPIFDCTNAAGRYHRMGSGLGVMNEAMRRTQQQLDALEEMQAAGSKEARDALVSRSVDSLESHATDEIEALMTLHEEAKGLVGEAAERAARESWAGKVLDLKGEIEDLQKLAQAFKAGQAYGKELQSRSHTVIEHLKEANKLFVESGLAEEIGGDLASLGGPLGAAAFEGALFVIDYAVADMDSFSRELEQRDLEEALSNMNHAYGEVKLKMADLQENCPNEFGRSSGTQSPPTASTSLTPPLPDPPAPQAPSGQTEVSAQKKKGGGNGSKVVVGVLGGVALAGAAVYAGSAMADLAAMSTGSTVSNRFCIVSVMGHGCDCAGSVTGETGWTGSVAGSGEGCGSGIPCAANLSCNNGRCEGSNGRCPF